jgi:hypothetical protein
MFTREGITNQVQDILRKRLEKNGFVLGTENEYGKYVKKYEWGCDYSFLPHIRFLAEHINFSTTIHRRINIVEEPWQEWIIKLYQIELIAD